MKTVSFIKKPNSSGGVWFVSFSENLTDLGVTKFFIQKTTRFSKNFEPYFADSWCVWNESIHRRKSFMIRTAVYICVKHLNWVSACLSAHFSTVHTSAVVHVFSLIGGEFHQLIPIFTTQKSGWRLTGLMVRIRPQPITTKSAPCTKCQANRNNLIKNCMPLRYAILHELGQKFQPQNESCEKCSLSIVCDLSPIAVSWVYIVQIQGW